MKKFLPILTALIFACVFAHADDSFDPSLLRGAEVSAADAARAAARGTPAPQSESGRAGAARGTPTAQTGAGTAASAGTAGRTVPTAASASDARTQQSRSVTARDPSLLRNAEVAAPATGTGVARTGTPRGGARGSDIGAAARHLGEGREVAATPAGAARAGANAPIFLRGEGTPAAVSRAGGIATRTGTPALAARAASVARAAVGGVPSVGSIGNYKECRDTYFQCMDEFCANKNVQLRRCACSSRVHEFDDARKQLDRFGDKVTEFNAQLLTVAMDKEDAAAIVRATEGEAAYTATDDKSESQKILDSIMGKLKKDSYDESMGRSMAAINLSMDIDAAFDTVDFMMGAETAAKEGESLYRAALPVCVEIATEICAPDDIKTVQSAYQMAIEQDCNSVSKTYAGLMDQAREKVREGGALLDMSRLANYQTRNADDILACKRKMMDQLADGGVCGPDLGKCLDWSGKYIDPATGAAILTADLYKLTDIIKVPTAGATWTRTAGNERFVSFLNAKKKYLEPAMAACEDIADRVWDAFLEDALPKIRLAQGKKMEEMRQSCIPLLSECMSGKVTSMENFDTRALSTFAVWTDRTANELCADIKTACSALMQHTGGEFGWGESVTNIQTDKTLEQILATCTEVGKTCIAEYCSNMSGKFGLCMESTDFARTNIINRNVCWDTVVSCVRNASTESIDNIMTRVPLFGGSPTSTPIMTLEYFNGATIYTRNSTTGQTTVGSVAGIYLNCDSGDNATTDVCRIAEKIWGNCDKEPTTKPADINNSKIKSGAQFENTLLTWLAENTSDGGGFICHGANCKDGTKPTPNGCKPAGDVTDDQAYCPVPPNTKITIATNWTNCCPAGTETDFLGNCCTGISSAKTFANLGKICVPSTANVTYLGRMNNGNGDYLFCMGLMTGTLDPSSDLTYICSGKFFVISALTKLYSSPGLYADGDCGYTNLAAPCHPNYSANFYCGYHLTCDPSTRIKFDVSHYVSKMPPAKQCKISFDPTGNPGTGFNNWSFSSPANGEGCQWNTPNPTNLLNAFIKY